MSELEVKRYRIGGMHCQACVNRVIKALQGVPGVQEAEVDLEAGEARIRLGGAPVPEAALAQAVQDAGYEFGGQVV